MNNISYFLIFNIFNLFSNSSASFYSNCRNFVDMDTCIEHTFCGWCNNTNIKNVSSKGNISSCEYANNIVFENDYDCKYNEHYRSMIIIVNAIITLSIIFIFFMSMLYIVNISNLILNKYFESSIQDSNTRSNEKSIILTIITSLIFIPAIILLFTNSNVFILYFMFILILSLIISCSVNTNKLYNYKTQTSTYTPIN